MDKDTETLTREVENLRLEVQQLRDLVRILLEIVMDHDPEEELPSPGFIPYLDNGRVTGDDYRDLGM